MKNDKTNKRKRQLISPKYARHENEKTYPGNKKTRFTASKESKKNCEKHKPQSGVEGGWGVRGRGGEGGREGDATS